ncbi:ubiquinone biosynthesis accessory factor UbiJ [Alteromonas lipolytica]|uniref:Ubiquinone biosynthesis accessory factor UbiJ n=1 Tax=Alteromonas lipolytica TaxID=1856405 RepID=A0A1E8FCL8_9ALTE|nr:SCP2 sterol-binding domain-containing protein [Alteromonas lipolytica]OFI33674.1 hypothetical protein BFC17_19020 [Alteromonas lipolytica]GGF69441.1 SCP2 domain-containing protein [Alteromonas lipolytica]
MPAVPLLTASVETALNKVLALDPDALNKLSTLQGKRLVVELTDVKQRFALAFSSKIDVLALPEPVTAITPEECVIKTRLSVLPQLRDTSQLTQLIKSGELEVVGELAIAQGFSGLLQSLNIDLEEQLALKTNDVIAHEVFSLAARAQAQLKTLSIKAGAILGSTLTDEKQLAAHKLAVLHFSDQVSSLRDDVERFETRLARLERNKQ